MIITPMKPILSNSSHAHKCTSPQTLDRPSFRFSQAISPPPAKPEDVPSNLMPLFSYLNGDFLRPKLKQSLHTKSLSVSQQNCKDSLQPAGHWKGERLGVSGGQKQLGYLSLGRFVSLGGQKLAGSKYKEKCANPKAKSNHDSGYFANLTPKQGELNGIAEEKCKVGSEPYRDKRLPIASPFRQRKMTEAAGVQILGRKRQSANDEILLMPLSKCAVGESANTSFKAEAGKKDKQRVVVKKGKEVVVIKNAAQESNKNSLLNKLKIQRLIESKPKVILANRLEPKKIDISKLLISKTNATIKSAQVSPQSKKLISNKKEYKVVTPHAELAQASTYMQEPSRHISSSIAKKTAASKSIYEMSYISLKKTPKHSSAVSTPEVTMLSNINTKVSTSILNNKDEVADREDESKIELTPLLLENVEELSHIKDREEIIEYITKYFKEHNEPPPTKTSFYRVGRLLGKGAFGKVNLGMHKLTGKLVAVKSINKKYVTSKESKRKMMQEFAILKSLRHPNIIRLYESFESAKHILIVTELCTGEDLTNYVRKKKRLDENVAKLVLRKVLEGLSHCHSRRVLHRDVKLDNILLNADGELKICDFGVSRTVREGEVMAEQSGTPAYIAPEIVRGKGYKDFAADVWSAGVVLFAVLYGTVPFRANDVATLHKLIVKGKYTLKDDITEEARDLLRRMLERNPCKRITIPEILAHRWMQASSTVSLFTEEERTALAKEYSCVRCKDASQSESLFTEQNIDSTFDELSRNNTSKSEVLAPFNSSVDSSEEREEWKARDKREVVRFGAKVRDLDRQYERNNNGEVDNGVYNKFMCGTSGENVCLSESAESSVTVTLEPKVRKSENTFLCTTDQSTGIWDINENALNIIESFGYPKDYVRKCLNSNELNHATATYYLLTNYYS